MNPTRRGFVGGAARFAASLLLAPHARLLAQAVGAPPGPGYGPLKPVRDLNTGLNLLALPEGFSYVTFGWHREPMADGAPTPGAHDGMGVVGQLRDRVTLVRNHEVVSDTGAFGPASLHYDPACGGGTTTIEFDAATGKAGRAHASLSGTVQNCAGGVTPWGTWLSCEEFVHDPDDATGPDKPRITRPHGYVFEVDPAGGKPEPLVGLGQFRHEAAALHAPSGAVYMTEDRDPRSGFYRFTPARRGRLAGKGVLEMLRVESGTDMRAGLRVGEELAASWVRIERPDRAHTAGTIDGLGVFTQGAEQGGAVFSRGEGCHATREAVYFTSTNGGAAACGQVFAYYPARGTLALVYESPGIEVLDYPDNLCFSPRGGLVLCEDGSRARMQLQGLAVDGRVFAFARNEVVLDGEPFGHAGEYRRGEWAGTCFSLDGKWLFANVYSPGFSVAIIGPWRAGLI
jgi:uncharacterized protein